MGVLFYPVLQVVAILRARERGVSLIAAIAPLVFVVSTLVLVGINRFVHRKGSAFGAWPLRWASPAIVAQFSSLFGL